MMLWLIAILEYIMIVCHSDAVVRKIVGNFIMRRLVDMFDGKILELMYPEELW